MTVLAEMLYYWKYIPTHAEIYEKDNTGPMLVPTLATDTVLTLANELFPRKKYDPCPQVVFCFTPDGMNRGISKVTWPALDTSFRTQET